ncbi:N-6 DNA methylase [Brevundimonas sp.]|uniref:N-6 DNA methylase n=1 Tax=Brevundimonas sp. TaxID=1871086 RepID=UPI0028A05A12|nr:N-6 DNA methylase [Brevundimonas sp.]
MTDLTSASSVAAVEGRLRAKLASQAVNDPEFSLLLELSANAIRSETLTAPNEATIESAFERHLFSLLRSIGIDYNPVKEGQVSGTILRQSGRTDSRFREVIIEFKNRTAMTSQANIDTHLLQLTDYMQALANGSDAEQVGFLTDGLRYVKVNRTGDGTILTSAPSPIDADGLRVICRTLIAARHSALNAENLVRDFCGTKEDGYLFKAARRLFQSIVKHATFKTEMLRSEWESLFRLAHEDTSQQSRLLARRAALSDIFDFKIDNAALEYLCLFSLHTSYAIIIKIMSYKVVSDTMFGTSLQDYKSLLSSDDDTIQAFCAALEEGDLFRQVGVLNLLEGDFFSWYSDKAQWNDDVAASVREILGAISRYEDARNIFAADKAVDLFRHLYEAAIPQVVRGSFGEFYTPLWLAQHVLESSGYKAGERVLDPCCGSGTFLIAALKKCRDGINIFDRPQALKTLLSSVVGIDLNPLAVLSARIHYFIYISDLIEANTDDIVIPVFLGDASNVPVIMGESGHEFLRYELNTLKTPLAISLPMRFVRDTDTLFKVMNEFEVLLAQGAYEEAKQVFEDCATRIAASSAERASLLSLADQIIYLEKNHWNGIWARIIANFASTVAIGKFERVIGNPPWIDWKSLPAGYRETVKALCIDKGLFSGAGRTGGINLNVCALITHVAATNWLAEGGRLSFLMPRELAVQPSYEGWRRSVGGSDCRLVEFHDWSNAGHPFEPVREDFMTFSLERSSVLTGAVACTSFEKQHRSDKPWLWDDLETAKANLNVRARVAKAIIPNSSAFTFADTVQELEDFSVIAGRSEYIGREGIEFYPQELVMFRYLKPGPKSGTVFVENFQGRKSKYKIPKQTILLETEFLFPLVKGPYIKPFEYEENDLLVALPYDSSDPHRPLSRSELRKKSPLLLGYFLKYEAQLTAQTAYSDAIKAEGEFYGLARTGPYSFAEHYVAFRDNTKWAACVVSDAAMPWGSRKRYLFQNHAVSMCERSDRSFITLDEAHYVSAILNARITSSFILASSDNRSFKIRPPIYIPLYDDTNELHRSLSELSLEAHLHAEKRPEAHIKASELYVRLCRER